MYSDPNVSYQNHRRIAMKQQATINLLFISILLLIQTIHTSQVAASQARTYTLEEIAAILKAVQPPQGAGYQVPQAGGPIKGEVKSNLNAEQSQSSTVSQSVYNLFEQCKNKAYESSQSFFEFLLKNKLKVAGVTVCMCYGYLYYISYTAHVLLDNKGSWCNWKEAISLPRLMGTSYHEIMPELILAIQKKYLFADTKSSHGVMNCFISDLKKEISSLEKQATIQKFTESCYLSQLLPCKDKLSIIQEKITRLHWLLDLFATWQTKEILQKG